MHAFGLDERTVAGGQKRAGSHCQGVHMAKVEPGQVKSQHLQAEERRAKGRKIIVWIALARDGSTRLWLAGAVSQQRDRRLIDDLFGRVRAGGQFGEGLLVCTDGFAALGELSAKRSKSKQGAGGVICKLGPAFGLPPSSSM